MIGMAKTVVNWDGDVWANHEKVSPVKAHNSLFSSASGSEWIVLMVTVTVLLLFDMFVLRRLPDTFWNHVGVLMFWILTGVGYNAYYWVRYGASDGLSFATGYFLEWLLSMDNLFVFHLIFRFYKTPAPLLHKALFFGIFGAVAFRILFFMALGSLLNVVHWIRFVFGAFLIYSGVQALYDEEDDEDASETYMVSMLRSCLGSRLKEDYDEQNHQLFVWEDGKLKATLLVMVIACLEVTDILFAVDSVSAKVAQIPNQYTAYSSSVMAIFGLRAMFFIIKDLVDYFSLLKYGLCIILAFIGLELMASDWVHLSSCTVCLVIVAVFATSMMGSVVKARIDKRKEELEKSDDNQSSNKANVNESPR